MHNDISKRNMSLFDNFHVKVGDLGAGIFTDRDSHEYHTDQIYEGPIYYPEAWEEELFGCRCYKGELFALACAVYEILA